jgi:hypothetical protein
MYIFVLCLFAFLSIPHSWLPNSAPCFSSIQAASFGQPAAVRAAQCPAADHTAIPRPRHVHVRTVDSGLWRLQLQRRLRRCAARPHRLLPHASWYTGPSGKGSKVGAARRFPRHTADDVSTLMCVLVWVCGGYLTAGCLTLTCSRSSYNHTYQHPSLCVRVCIYLF